MARVWVLPGMFPASMMVAPNSPRARAKVSTVPEMIPGRQLGKTIRQKMAVSDRPRVRPASMRSVSICSKTPPGRAVHQWEGHHRGGDDHPHPGEHDLDAELGQPFPDAAGLAEEHQQEEAHHRRGQHQGQGEDSVPNPRPVAHPRHLLRRVYPDKKGDDRGDARSPQR